MRWVFSFVFLCFLGTVYLKGPPALGLKKKPLYFTPPRVLKHFHLGFSDFMADLLWLRYLQNADFCSFEKGLPVYKGDKKTCYKGWAYHMADVVTELAPQFQSPYLFSTVMMHIFAGDRAGAEAILQKALRIFPKDKDIHFYAAYLYSSQEDQRLAAHHATQSALYGGPKWLYRLASPQKTIKKQALRNVKKSLFKNLLKTEPLTGPQKQELKTQMKE